MRRTDKCSRLILLSALLIAMNASAAFSQSSGGTFTITSHVAAGGGCAPDGSGGCISSTGGVLGVDGTAGEPGAVEMLTQSPYQLRGGFWYATLGATPTAADGNVGGRIVDTNGLPIAGVAIRMSGSQLRIAITDANGNYSFDNVETNGFYTVTPSRTNYAFSPANRSFSLLGVHTEASFTATANGDHLNAIDTTEFFVRQQYLDFLGREPDPPGFTGWVNTINNCAAGDTSCDRVHVSEMFFRSQEFQQRGYFVYRFYSTALGRKPDYAEFTPDMARVSGFLTNDQLEAAKTAFANDFMTRPSIAAKFNSLDNAAYVDALVSTAGVNVPNRQTLIDSLNAGTLTRAHALRQIAESGEVYGAYYNQAFVVMEYFGYLRRDPDALYVNWIQVLDQGGDSRHMVEGFVDAAEYRNRF
jgi:hypothetical protein